MEFSPYYLGFFALRIYLYEILYHDVSDNLQFILIFELLSNVVKKEDRIYPS